jgi:hypothetical protein
VQNSVLVNAHSIGTVNAVCPPGEQVLGGGGGWDGVFGTLVESTAGTVPEWIVIAQNTVDSPEPLQVQAICAVVP